VCAIDKLLVHFPTNWAHVSVLAHRLLNQASVVVEVLHYARSVVEVQISCKLETRLCNFLYRIEGNVFHVPAGLHSVHTDKTVVVFLVEEAGLRDILGKVVEATDKNVAVASELFNFSCFSALEDFFCGNLYIEHNIWVHAKLSHLNSLCPVLRESIYNPATFQTISHLNAHS